MILGLQASWYDLADDEAPASLAWLHETYLPWLAATPGFAWVAHYRATGGGPQMRDVKTTVVSHTDDPIGQGTGFLLLVGAADVHRFFTADVTEAPLPDGFAERLSQRAGLRTAWFTREAIVEGPAAAALAGQAGQAEQAEQAEQAGPAPAIQFGTLRPRSPEAEVDLIRWYAQYRMPSMARMAGSLRTRKWSGVAGWPKHGILYEFESLAARLRHFEQGHESLALDPGHWTNRITRASWHAPGSPFIGERTWPPVA